MGNKEKFIKLLNIAFENEYNDVFLYLKEADLFRKKMVSGDKIGGIFNDFSVMELRHADRLAMKMIELGVKAEWVFKPLEPSNSIREVLENHVKIEANSVKYYDEMLKVCEDKDFIITIKGIREDEKEHLEKVSHILKKIRD